MPNPFGNGNTVPPLGGDLAAYIASLRARVPEFQGLSDFEIVRRSGIPVVLIVRPPRPPAPQPSLPAPPPIAPPRWLQDYYDYQERMRQGPGWQPNPFYDPLDPNRGEFTGGYGWPAGGWIQRGW
jgi:hypothetical protein